MSPFEPGALTGRYLSFADREEIALLKAQGALSRLRAQQPPFAPLIAGAPDATTLTWPRPAVPGLLG